MQNDRTCTVSETIISPVISGVSQNKVQIKLRIHFCDLRLSLTSYLGELKWPNG